MSFLRNQWDRVAAWALIALGGLCLLLGWLGVSDAVLTTEQLPFIISGGLGGVCFIGIGITLWLSADLRDDWSELHEIARRLPVPEAADGPGDEELVAPRPRRGRAR
jgi:hypothetical protein